MFDRAAVLNPGEVDGKLDIGSVLESMLYYAHVDYIVDSRSFTQLWFNLGATGTQDLLTHPSLRVRITPEMPVVYNSTRNFVRTHRPSTITSSGTADGVIFDPRDIARALHQQINNREPTALSAVRKVVRLFPDTRFAKLMTEVPTKGDLFESLISDSASMRIFLRAFAQNRAMAINEKALASLEVEVTPLGDDNYFILNNIALQEVIPGQTEIDGWDQILPYVLDYAYDLLLAQARSADVITSDVNSYIASERIDLSINRALHADAKKSAFEEFAFDEVRAFREAFNAGELSLADALRAVDETAKFREWLCGLAPDADVIKEYHKAVTKETILGRLPGKATRFAFFAGGGLLVDSIGAGGLGTAGALGLSAFDTFVLEGLLKGWRPNHFVSTVQNAIKKKR